MSRGQSGRVVIEIDPQLKREVYTILASEGLTLREWFIREASAFVSRSEQPLLPLRGVERPSRKRQAS